MIHDTGLDFFPLIGGKSRKTSMRAKRSIYKRQIIFCFWLCSIGNITCFQLCQLCQLKGIHPFFLVREVGKENVLKARPILG